MEENAQSAVKRLTLVCSLALTGGWFLSTFLPQGDSWGLFGILSAAVLCCIWRKKQIGFTIIDAGVIGIWLYDLVSLTWSINSSPTIVSLYTETTAVACYFLVRYLSQFGKGIRWLLGIFCVIIGIIVVIGLGTFWFYIEALKEIGIENTYFFRHLYRPFALAPNDWAGLLWLFGGIVAVAYTVFEARQAKRWLLVFGICILFLIVVSFSRGMYISLGIFFITAIVYLFRRPSPERLWIFGILFAFLIITAVLFRVPVCSTLRMGETVSQQRSTSGRIEMIEEACETVKEYPVVGVGMGNFTLALNPSYFEDDRVGFTSYAPNLLVQIAVEKGIFGLILYLGWAGGILFYCIRNSQSAGRVALFFLFLYAVREQTFPIFLESGSAQCLVFILLAVMQSHATRQLRGSLSSKGYTFVFPVLLLVTCIGTSCFIWKTVRNNRHFRACETALVEKNWEVVQYELAACSRSTPAIVNSALAYAEIYEHTKKDDLLRRADSLLQVAIARNPKDNYPLYLQAMRPMLSENYPESERLLRELVTKYPNNAIYRFGFFKCLYQQTKTDEAAEQLSRCIVLSPRIMDTEFWGTSAQRDSILFEKTRGRLQAILQDSSSGPLLSARLGKIAFELGDHLLAEKYLSESLRQLPNLSGAWYNLGQVYCKMGNDRQASVCFKRAYRLERGVFAPLDRLDDYLQSRNILRMTPEILLRTRYAMKFQRWYSSRLLLDGIN